MVSENEGWKGRDETRDEGLGEKGKGLGTRDKDEGKGVRHGGWGMMDEE